MVKSHKSNHRIRTSNTKL